MDRVEAQNGSHTEARAEVMAGNHSRVFICYDGRGINRLSKVLERWLALRADMPVVYHWYHAGAGSSFDSPVKRTSWVDLMQEALMAIPRIISTAGPDSDADNVFPVSPRTELTHTDVASYYDWILESSIYSRQMSTLLQTQYIEFIKEITAEIQLNITYLPLHRVRARISNFKFSERNEYFEKYRIGKHRSTLVWEDYFILDRFVNMHEEDRKSFDVDLRRLGSPAVVLTELAGFVFDQLSAGGNEMLALANLDFCHSSWARWLATSLGIEIEIGASPALPACLIQTRESSAICLADHLTSQEMTEYILHEVSHVLLGHRPNTEYGLDPAKLKSRMQRKQFERQEQEADALSKVFLHLFDGVTEILSGRSKVSPLKGATIEAA